MDIKTYHHGVAVMIVTAVVIHIMMIMVVVIVTHRGIWKQNILYI